MENSAPSPTPTTGGKALLAGGLAALFASACCLGPLALIMVGVSGAWISHLTALEPYRPIFVVATLVALYFAWGQIWRPAAACEPGEACAAPSVKRAYKALFGVVVALLVLTLGFPLVAAWFY